MIVYFNDRIPEGPTAQTPAMDEAFFMPLEQVRISPNDRGFLFGDGVYEVIRVYHGQPYRADAHLIRLKASLNGIRIRGLRARDLEPICHALLQRNELTTGHAAIYIQVTRGAAPRQHVFPPEGTPITIYIHAYAFTEPEAEWEHGVKAITVPDIRWSRCDIKAVTLLPNVLAAQRARDQGAHLALFVRDGLVLEGTHNNFCAVWDQTLFTTPDSNQILKGITKDVLFQICRDLDIAVKTVPVTQSDLMHRIHNDPHVECFVAGTTTEVMPVIELDGVQIGDGTPGPITRTFQAQYRARTRSQTPTHKE